MLTPKYINIRTLGGYTYETLWVWLPPSTVSQNHLRSARPSSRNINFTGQRWWLENPNWIWYGVRVIHRFQPSKPGLCTAWNLGLMGFILGLWSLTTMKFKTCSQHNYYRNERLHCILHIIFNCKNMHCHYNWCTYRGSHKKCESWAAVDTGFQILPYLCAFSAAGLFCTKICWHLTKRNTGHFAFLFFDHILPQPQTHCQVPTPAKTEAKKQWHPFYGPQHMFSNKQNLKVQLCWQWKKDSMFYTLQPTLADFSLVTRLISFFTCVVQTCDNFYVINFLSLMLDYHRW